MATVALPNPIERKRIFYWLKRNSSYTARNRVLGFYQAWAAVCERIAQEMEDEQTRSGKTAHFDTRDLIGVLKGLAHYEKGVELLRQGSKKVFRYASDGYFMLSTKEPSYWVTLIHRAEIGENEIHEDEIPHWEEFTAALYDLESARGECAYIGESRWTDGPAPLSFGHPMETELGMTFPDPLPDVPQPARDVLVKTGDTISCSGIWEPVKVELSNTLMGLFKKPLPPVDGIWKLDGCMNYLHADSPAPQAEIGDIAAPGMQTWQKKDVYWRLIWRDDRYEDGTIPPEEVDYVFQQPALDRAERARRQVAKTGNIAAAAAGIDLIVARSGQPAPRRGHWAMLGDVREATDAELGQPLPTRGDKQVEWVWVR